MGIRGRKRARLNRPRSAGKKPPSGKTGEAPKEKAKPLQTKKLEKGGSLKGSAPARRPAHTFSPSEPEGTRLRA